jgi:hypothetical protein
VEFFFPSESSELRYHWRPFLFHLNLCYVFRVFRVLLDRLVSYWGSIYSRVAQAEAALRYFLFVKWVALYIMFMLAEPVLLCPGVTSWNC